MSNDFDQFLSTITRARQSLRVCGDRQLLYERRDAVKSLRSARDQAEKAAKKGDTFLDDDLPGVVEELEARVQGLDKQVETRSIELSFEALDRKMWSDLLSKHPPSKKQKAEQGLNHNPETFYPAAINASCVEPEMSYEQAQAFVDKMPMMEVEKIMAVVYELHTTGGPDPFDDLATVNHQRGEKKSTPPPSSTPPAPSS